jgi:hypothetical protein
MWPSATTVAAAAHASAAAVYAADAQSIGPARRPPPRRRRRRSSSEGRGGFVGRPRVLSGLVGRGEASRGTEGVMVVGFGKRKGEEGLTVGEPSVGFRVGISASSFFVCVSGLIWFLCEGLKWTRCSRSMNIQNFFSLFL